MFDLKNNIGFQMGDYLVKNFSAHYLMTEVDLEEIVKLKEQHQLIQERINTVRHPSSLILLCAHLSMISWEIQQQLTKSIDDRFSEFLNGNQNNFSVWVDKKGNVAFNDRPDLRYQHVFLVDTLALADKLDKEFLKQ